MLRYVGDTKWDYYGFWSSSWHFVLLQQGSISDVPSLGPGLRLTRVTSLSTSQATPVASQITGTLCLKESQNLPAHFYLLDSVLVHQLGHPEPLHRHVVTRFAEGFLFVASQNTSTTGPPSSPSAPDSYSMATSKP